MSGVDESLKIETERNTFLCRYFVEYFSLSVMSGVDESLKIEAERNTFLSGLIFLYI